MTNKPELKIEAGRFYRMRCGYKYRCYATDGYYPHPIHGAALIDKGWSDCCHTKEGKDSLTVEEHPLDLISEWIDAPEVDWSKMAAWHNWVAMDEDGKWFAFSIKPQIDCDSWLSGNGYDCYGEIITDCHPKFTGDWKDSLVCRPGVEK